MNCQRFETLLTDYIDDALDPRVKGAIDTHLEDCAGCRSLAQEVENLCVDLSNFPEVSVPPELIDRILESTSGKRKAYSFWQDMLLPAVRPFLTQRYAFATVMMFVFLSFAVNLAGPEFSASSLSPSGLAARADRISSQVYKKWAEFNDFKTRVSEEFTLLKEDLWGRLDYHLVTIMIKSYRESLDNQNQAPEDGQKVEDNSEHE